jgi:hypothetical protein
MDETADGYMDIYIIPRFRLRYFLPDSRACPIVPVVFVVLQDNHFFTVVMDHKNARVYILGRSSVSSGDDVAWQDWNGPRIYSHICRLHGWRVLDDVSAVQVHDINWRGNGYDCGPTSIRVALDLFQHGLDSLEAMERCARGCGHLTRLSIYHELQARCRASYRYYQLSLQNPPEEWSSWDTAEAHGADYAISRLDKEQIDRVIRVGHDSSSIQKLHIAISGCRECRTNGQVIEGGCNEGRDDLEGCKERDLDCSDKPYGDLDDQEQQHHSSSDVSNSGPGIRRPGTLRRGRRHVRDWTQLEPVQYPRPCPPKHIPLPEGALWLRHDPHFDDYDSGPTREELRAYEDPICNFPFNPYAQPFRKSFWTTFRDYGYRLLSSFPHMVYLGEPAQIEEHILRDGLPDDYDPGQLYPNVFKKGFNLSRSAYPDLLKAKYMDVEIMGAQEMLNSIDNEFSWEGHDLFVRGRNKDGKYVCLDLERDSVDPEEVPLSYSIDLDSFNWVTNQIRTKLKIQLMVTPTVRKTPPIRKSNHVYFKLLVPPTEAERVLGDRDWLELQMSLSSCPHTLFAKVAEGVNIYVLFPRMIHRDEHSGRRVSFIPLVLQTMFWDKVLLPALKEHMPAASLPYVDFTVEEFHAKTAPKHKPKGADHFSGISKAIDPSVLEKMIPTMREIIRNDYRGDMLHRFGSFFFVLEGKGIKLYTQESLSSSGSNAWQRLIQEFPQLDFNYMMDANHGQLVVDVGISINPDADSMPVVGLLRLDALEASFGAGGFRKGQVHSVNTLGRYGAIQAEMQSERMRRTHIIFRSTYSLQYEPTRRKDNQPFFAGDGDAYELNGRWNEACEVRERLYQGGVQERSYGVRDEYRVGGLAVKTLLENAKTLVCGSYTLINSQDLLAYLKSLMNS